MTAIGFAHFIRHQILFFKILAADFIVRKSLCPQFKFPLREANFPKIRVLSNFCRALNGVIELIAVLVVNVAERGVPIRPPPGEGLGTKRCFQHRALAA